VRLLLDSHILLAVQRRDKVIGNASIDRIVRAEENDRIVSAASLWELALKHRLGKLHLDVQIEELPEFCLSMDFELLSFDHRHAVVALHEMPATRDPFDRLLLAQCQIEGLKLVTLDRALARHSLAWRAT
jgi:PIN domain nuclease of toxin-antitoxin system